MESCKWDYADGKDGWGSNDLKTECGNISRSFQKQEYRYCPFCGKEIESPIHKEER